MNKSLLLGLLFVSLSSFMWSANANEDSSQTTPLSTHNSEDHDGHDDDHGGESHSDHDEADGEHDEHSEDGHVEVSPARASKAGISIATVGSQPISDSLVLFGKTEPDPQKVSHVRARYPGLIRTVGPALGERVSAGQTIATIEGNQSLQSYSVKAPISGIVVERHANSGEYAGNEPLLTIADFSRLWVSLTVFPKDAARIQAGQSVRVFAGNRQAESQIAFLNPSTDSRPSIMARLPLPNDSGTWTPGLLVEAEVVVNQRTVPLAVNNNALHRVEGQLVVFLQEGDGFKVTPVTLGVADGSWSEVISGLSEGDRYAVENSYLLKAELEKSGASHSH